MPSVHLMMTFGTPSLRKHTSHVAPCTQQHCLRDTPVVFLKSSGSGTNLLTHKQGVGDAEADHCRRDQTGELRPDQQKALPQ